MKHRIAVAACAAVALIAVACSDSDTNSRRLATEPGPTALDQGVHYTTTGVAAIVGAHHVQQPFGQSTAPAPNASITAQSLQATPLMVGIGDPGIAKTGGYRLSSFVDDGKHRHTIAMLYASTGGPPQAVQHYIDGKLVSTNAIVWTRSGSEWVRTRSYLQSVRNGRLFGTYTTTTALTGTAPVGGGDTKPMVRLGHPAPPSALQRALGTAAYDLAYVFAPQDATAQSLAIDACRQQWLRFLSAAAVVVGIEVTIADMPEMTPVLVTQFLSALANLAAAEDALLDCVLSHQPIPTVDNWSSGMGGGSGSGSGSAEGKDCLEGSYAAHCSTALTL